MRSMLHDFSVGQYDNLIRMLDRRKTVRYDQHRSDVLHLFHGILDQKLGFGVDVRRRLVKDHDRRLMDDGTRKREKLALSGGEVVSSLPHRLVEAVIQLVDKLVSIHVMADVHDLFIGNPLLAENNVATDRSREQEDILQHLAEFFPQGIDLDLSDVDAVDQNLTLLELVVPADQGKNRRFSLSCQVISKKNGRFLQLKETILIASSVLEKNFSFPTPVLAFPSFL